LTEVVFSCYRNEVCLFAVLASAITVAAPKRSGGAALRQGTGWDGIRPGAGSALVDGEVGLMSLRQRYLKILSLMLPAGAVGVTLVLGVAAPAAADQGPLSAGSSVAGQARVSERLAAIRDAVSDVGRPSALKAGEQLAWWAWRNGGGGWRNGGGGWRNGGWRNGGWRNGGWGNAWRNW
jgi:rSAM-associated Gly-rich repeat protein